ncbi:MAG: NUDIX domain-containing protein [Candidatus Micrarchaeaceae archaeon]|jgi:colanic acid biosynthesis protein WcaH
MTTPNLKIDPRNLPEDFFLAARSALPMVYTDIIINVDGKALVGKRTGEPLKGELGPIGGRVFYGESLNDAAVRKVKEETGLIVELVGIIEISQIMFSKKQQRHCIDFVYLANKVGGTLRLDNQHSEFVLIDHIEPTMAKFLQSALRKSMIFDKEGRKPKLMDVPFFNEDE